jgi:hypothetical protein
MNGGLVIINGPTDDMNGALDHLAFNITCGSLIAVGSSGMAQSPGTFSTQYSVMLNFWSPNPAGTLIHVRSSDGIEVFTLNPAKRYQSVVFSLPNLTRGTTYEVHLGGSHSGTLKDGLYHDGIYTLGRRHTTFTITSILTKIGPSGGFFF